MICINLWWSSYIIKLYKTNNICYFFKLFWNMSTAQSRSWMCLVAIYDITYSRNMWAVLNQKFPDIINEDNTACITHVKNSYIKGDIINPISPKFFIPYVFLHKSGDIEVRQIQSNNNFPDLFTKALPITTFRKKVNNIRMSQLKDILPESRGAFHQ